MSVGIALRLAVMALYLAAVLPLHLISLRFGWRPAGWIPVYFHRLFLALFDVRVRVRGQAPGDEPTLVLANHVSWLDIAVIGSLRPLSFIAKAEIEGWPLFGAFARWQRSVFIDRTRRAATAEANAAVAHRLARGEAMVLFPEGTTSDGNHLLPFRSSVVGAAQAALIDPQVEGVRLQPLTVAYTRRNGLPVTRRERPSIAWYGDMDLAPHLLDFARGGPLDVEVIWGEPLSAHAAAHRKRAAVAAEAAVRRDLALAQRRAA